MDYKQDAVLIMCEVCNNLKLAQGIALCTFPGKTGLKILVPHLIIKIITNYRQKSLFYILVFFVVVFFFFVVVVFLFLFFCCFFSLKY